MYLVFQKFNSYITKVLESVIFILFATMVIVSFSQVVTRFLEYPLYWSEELARYIAIWLTFLGASYALRKKGLAVVEALVYRLQEKPKKFLILFVNILIIVFCAIMIIYGFKLVAKTISQSSPALLIPMGLVYLSAPIGGALMMLYTLEEILAGFCNKQDGR